ncbi:hypothetical protein D3Z55_09380 [Clostridiaceae bacterium]|nr:hypothetical protein [Clostridiaceae bacterium]
MSKMVRTLSEEAKDIIRNYVEMGREYDRKELVAEIKEKAERKEEMTDGVIAGAIKMLTASNEIMVAARGRYRKGSPVGNQNMQEKVVALFQKFKGDLDKICMVNALNLKEDDFRFITLLNEISNNLESSIWTLEDFGKEGAGAGEAPASEGETEGKELGRANERKEKKEKKQTGEPMKEAV